MPDTLAPSSPTSARTLSGRAIALLVAVVLLSGATVRPAASADAPAAPPSGTRSPATPDAAPAAKPARPPNVVIIFCDDLGYGDPGCFGAKGYKTPAIDALAAGGVRFTDFLVPQAVCSASRVGLLTGCYPNRVGILGALGPNARIGIADGEVTLAELCKARGYATAIFGKWHLGHHPRFLPIRHGFDEYFGIPYSNDMWPRHPTAKFPDLPLIEGDKTVALNPDQRQLTTQLTERAVRFIESRKDGPFFLYLAHPMPHVPLHVSDRHAGKTERGLFGDVITEIDWSVGQVVDTLRKHGLEENTLVVFTSDNGPWLSYGDHAGSAGPLREGKGTAFDGGVRVPFVARWPARIPAGSVVKTPAMTIDLFPTVAALIGGKLPDHPIDGRDITGLLTSAPGAVSPQEAYFLWWGKALHAVRAGRWKLHFPHPYQHVVTPGKDGRPGKAETRQTGVALYDLEADPGEGRDLAKENPEVVKRLEALADKARRDLGDDARKVEGTGVRKPGTLPAE